LVRPKRASRIRTTIVSACFCSGEAEARRRGDLSWSKK
jgi:hypothetical protein